MKQMAAIDAGIAKYFQENYQDFTDPNAFKQIFVQTYPRSGTNYTCRTLNHLLNLYPLQESHPSLFSKLMDFESSTLSSLFWSSSSVKETILFDSYYGEELKMRKGMPFLSHQGNYLALLGNLKVVKLHHYHTSPVQQKTVLVIRYPYDTIRSHILTHHEKPDQPLQRPLVEPYLREYQENLVHYRSLSSSPNFLVVRYEDYFHDYSGSISRIMDFYGLDTRFPDHWLKQVAPDVQLRNKHMYWTDNYATYHEDCHEWMQQRLAGQVAEFWPEKSTK